MASVDKANVLETSLRLWREVAIAWRRRSTPRPRSPTCWLDNCAMQLASNLAQFDVLVTENTSWRHPLGRGLHAYRLARHARLRLARLRHGPVRSSHGSAPDIAGEGHRQPARADPLRGAFMLRYSFHMDDAADEVARAVQRVLDNGWRTVDIADAQTPKDHVLGTVAMRRQGRSTRVGTSPNLWGETRRCRGVPTAAARRTSPAKRPLVGAMVAGRGASCYEQTLPGHEGPGPYECSRCDAANPQTRASRRPAR